MKGRYEIKDSKHPTWRGGRWTDLARAKREIQKGLDFGTPAGRFVIKDRLTKEIVG